MSTETMINQYDNGVELPALDADGPWFWRIRDSEAYMFPKPEVFIVALMKKRRFLRAERVNSRSVRYFLKTRELVIAEILEAGLSMIESRPPEETKRSDFPGSDVIGGRYAYTLCLDYR